jgi:tetrahydromethanopterin S-methyltransferase subunit G
MQNPLKRKPNPYVAERERLLEVLAAMPPSGDEYKNVMARLDQLDKILNRTSELKKTVIPAIGTIGAVTGIYALQQFAGVIVPKALDALASRSSKKHPNEFE